MGDRFVDPEKIKAHTQLDPDRVEELARLMQERGGDHAPRLLGVFLDRAEPATTRLVKPARSYDKAVRFWENRDELFDRVNGIGGFFPEGRAHLSVQVYGPSISTIDEPVGEPATYGGVSLRLGDERTFLEMSLYHNDPTVHVHTQLTTEDRAVYEIGHEGFQRRGGAPAQNQGSPYNGLTGRILGILASSPR